MTESNEKFIEFPSCKRRKVGANFGGGDVTSDGGSLLLRQVDRRLGLTNKVSQVLTDSRRQASCEHDVRSMLRQRVYGLALGYENVNDHQLLRRDPVLQTAVERDRFLAVLRWTKLSARWLTLKMPLVAR